VGASCKHENKRLCLIKGGAFFGKMDDCQFLRKGCAPWWQLITRDVWKFRELALLLRVGTLFHKLCKWPSYNYYTCKKNFGYLVTQKDPHNQYRSLTQHSLFLYLHCSRNDPRLVLQPHKNKSLTLSLSSRKATKSSLTASSLRAEVTTCEWVGW